MLRHRCGRGALQSPIYLEGPLYSAMSVSLGREPLTSLQAKDFVSQRASTQVVRLPTVTPFRSSVILTGQVCSPSRMITLCCRQGRSSPRSILHVVI